jgi:hypothetical protein
MVFEIKIAVDVVLAEDGLVDSCTMKGDAVHRWTEGPFDTERKARENLQWQFAREPISVKKAPTVVPRPQVADAVHRVVRNLKPIPQCGVSIRNPVRKRTQRTAAVVLVHA